MFRSLVRCTPDWRMLGAAMFGCLWVSLTQAQPGSLPEAEKLEFFEARIRPVLIERCYACHNSHDTTEADLALDHREGLRKRTESGIVVVPGKPEESVLLKVIRHELEGLEMPEGDAPLDDQVIADFETWIHHGAVDPRDRPPTEAELATATAWDATLEKRKQWWSLLPIQSPDVPNNEAQHPIDRFLREALREAGLEASERAAPETVVRRLTFVLTGLPPNREQIERFRSVDTPADYEAFVDELLASPAFGERWARHFMDLVRYADSHGSEGDPTIPHAYRYRDYLIRALNQDVPYDQLVREHIAGDLLDEPRINSELGINESVIGAAHWRMVFHGFAPTDALDEKVRFVDDQINVFSKAFLGLTVSCARCHNHKFDAISQSDYYALFGVLASCRPALVDANTRANKRLYQGDLREIKQQLRQQSANAWVNHLPSLRKQLASLGDSSSLDSSSLDSSSPELRERVASAKETKQLLNLWHRLNEQLSAGRSMEEAWKGLADEWQQAAEKEQVDTERADRLHNDFAKAADYHDWFAQGNGLPPNPQPAGDFQVALDGDRAIAQIFPACIQTASLSSRHRGFLASPKLKLDKEYRVVFRVAGDQNPSARYCVQHYPRNGTVYPISSFNHRDWRLLEYDMKYWKGDDIHFELATARDAPVQVRNDSRSWFAVREVVVRDADGPAVFRNDREFLAPVFQRGIEQAPASTEQFATLFVETLEDTILAWRDRRCSDAQALLLDRAIAEGLLPNDPKSLHVEDLIVKYRELESQIPEPFRVPGLAESQGWDHPLFVRGDHHQPAEPVTRRFLEAIDERPIKTSQSGRLELADKVLSSTNPLTARVIVNRLWHHAFGSGLVTTPDNFGRLGSKPSHPELLDYLATRFVDDGWSIKRALKFMVTSEAWQASSVPSERAREIDPDNRWWSHARVRRLDAEAIRDSLLAVTGRLDFTMFGPTVAANQGSDRRSVYVEVRRNSLDQFLHAYDAPVPFSTKGRRDATNVPAQSLTMLNDPFVRGLADRLANDLRVAAEETSDQDVLHELVIRTLGREPSRDEIEALRRYLQQIRVEIEQAEQQRKEYEKKQSMLLAKQASLIEPTRERILADRQDNPDAVELPVPLLHWDFSDGLADRVGQVSGTLQEDAQLDQGKIVLRGNGYFSSPSIAKPLAEKTLVATVQLETLEQRGGGVISVQTNNGVLFDAIVFGERTPKHWIAGSNNFARTDDFQGEPESLIGQPIQLAIAYDADGTIRAYRNGMPYGQPTRKGGLLKFNSNDWQVLVGLRHGNTGRLRGDVMSAAVFDRALSADEVAALALGASYVSRDDIIDAMTEQQRETYREAVRMLSRTQEQLAGLPEPAQPSAAWSRVVHAVLNLKEFIYLR